MKPSPKTESIRQRLNNLAQSLKLPYRNVETVFLIERLVARLVADETLRGHLIFKGGFVGLKVYDSPRYTIDLDALLVKSNIEDTLARVKQRAELDSGDGTWFRFESQVSLTTQGEYGGIRQIFRVGIGEIPADIRRAQTLYFDLGIGDPVTPGPRQVTTPSLIPQNQDLSWSVYPVETICAEKLHALLLHGDANSRSKDVYDLSLFLPKADGAILGLALKRCFKFRDTSLPEKISADIKKINTQRLEQGWVNSVSTVPNAPDFRTSFEVLLKALTKLEKSF